MKKIEWSADKAADVDGFAKASEPPDADDDTTVGSNGSAKKAKLGSADEGPQT